nr:YhgE/Pip family protein [Saccharopolyspora sp. HNM0983]
MPVIGLLLVPLAIAGVLVWALGDPDEQRGGVKAAIVNNDEPVEVQGQLTPLGRQLSGKLAGDEIDSNYEWEFANQQTAAEGLQDGTYAAVVTIPENFSAAATSFSGDPAQAQQATIDVTTGERSKLADEAVSREVTSTATGLLGNELTTTYLDNLYVGFNTLGDQLGEASNGATSLADGAEQLAGGTEQLAAGGDELAGGSRALADGIGQLGGGADQLAEGANGLAAGLAQMREQTAALPEQAGTLADVSAQENEGVTQIRGELQTMADDLGEMTKTCPPGTLPVCTKVAIQAAKAEALAEGAGQVQLASDGISGGLDALAGRTPESGGGLGALSGGVDQLAGGADQLAGGADQLAGGLQQTGDGANGLADGADQLSGGIRELSNGASQLGDGTGELSSGLDRAVEELPTYSEGERDQLAQTVADPISAEEGTGHGFGSSGPPLYAVLALWAGALATFLVLRPVPGHALESTRSSLRLVWDGFRLPAAVAAVQGLLVSAVVGAAQGLAAGPWAASAGLLVLIALAFTAVNQALGAVGGFGRFLSMLVGLLVLATGFTTAVPGVLQQITGVLPVGPALDGLRAVFAATAPGGGGIAALVVWALAGLAVSYLAVERTRTVKATGMAVGHGLQQVARA